MAPGVGLFDYDNDGDLDVYLVQGAMLGAKKTLKDATFPPAGPLGDRLFRNDLTVAADGTRTLRFTDVTGPSGIDVTSYGMGVAAGDVDNDGFVDLYRTGLVGFGAAAQQRQRHVQRRDREDAASAIPAAGACRPRSSTTTATAGSISTSATICSTASPATWTACSVTGQHDYCPPNSYRRPAGSAVSQPRQRHVRGRHVARAGRRRGRSGARRLDGGLRRRRLDRHLRRQRRHSRISCGSTRRTARSRTRRSSRARR